jgi:hypothetical protein
MDKQTRNPKNIHHLLIVTYKMFKIKRGDLSDEVGINCKIGQKQNNTIFIAYIIN